MKKILGIGVILLSILFTGCSSDNDDNSETSNSISATINGVDWKPTKFAVSLIKIPGSGQRFDINAQDDKIMLLLACESDFTTQNAMPLREYNFYEEIEETYETEKKLASSDALFVNTYLIDGNSYTEHFPKSGKITITAMDSEKKTVSGTFSFTSTKEGILQTKIVTPEVFEVKNGVFKDLPYQVVTTPAP